MCCHAAKILYRPIICYHACGTLDFNLTIINQVEIWKILMPKPIDWKIGTQVFRLCTQPWIIIKTNQIKLNQDTIAKFSRIEYVKNMKFTFIEKLMPRYGRINAQSKNRCGLICLYEQCSKPSSAKNIYSKHADFSVAHWIRSHTRTQNE